jgi:hypothetical protein
LYELPEMAEAVMVALAQLRVTPPACTSTLASLALPA